MRLLSDHLAPRLLGKDAERVEAIWHELEFATHATTIGAISSLALAAIDTALWDLRAKRQRLPLWIVAGGAADRRPLYTTEGGWLHIDEGALVEDALAAREKGFTGSKIKIGRAHVSEDYRRLAAVRAALGPGYEIMTDANQGFTLDEGDPARAAPGDARLAWIEEPLPADDLDGHVRLSRATTTPIAIGESLYSIRHFREYMASGACSIVQVDVARIGGITPWLKVAHIAEAFDLPVCPHFLMELHVSLACSFAERKIRRVHPATRRTDDDVAADRERHGVRADDAGNRRRMGPRRGGGEEPSRVQPHFPVGGSGHRRPVPDAGDAGQPHGGRMAGDGRRRFITTEDKSAHGRGAVEAETQLRRRAILECQRSDDGERDLFERRPVDIETQAWHLRRGDEAADDR